MGTDSPHTEAVSPGCSPSPCVPHEGTLPGCLLHYNLSCKGFSCSIFWTNFRNLFSPSDMDSWGSLQAAWNEKSMVTAEEWAWVH